MPERYDIACGAFAFTLIVTLAIGGVHSIPLLAARAWGDAPRVGVLGLVAAKLIFPLQLVKEGRGCLRSIVASGSDVVGHAATCLDSRSPRDEAANAIPWRTIPIQTSHITASRLRAACCVLRAACCAIDVCVHITIQQHRYGEPHGVVLTSGPLPGPAFTSFACWTKTMLTIDDIRAVPLFAALADDELDHLAHTSADLHLCAGEFAVHEGGERALYAVLAGKMEVIKTFDGVERTLGWRLPGTIFGEVPLALSSPFPGAYRAAEPSRVMRVDAQRYYELAAGGAGRGRRRMGALARERIGGLQGLSAEPPKPRVTMVGNRWDNACTALRQFLARNQISFAELDYAGCARTARALAGNLSGRRAMSRGAAIRWHRAEPAGDARAGRIARLADAAPPRRIRHDDHRRRAGRSRGSRIRRVGRIAVRSCSSREAPGGHKAGTSSRASKTTWAFPTACPETNSRAVHCSRQRAARRRDSGDARSVARIAVEDRQVHLDGGDVIRAKTIILATGVTWRRLLIEGFDRFIGKGIYYGASRSEASATHGLDVYLIGGGNSAGQAALYFANHARMVTLILRGDSLEKSMSRYLVEQLRGKSRTWRCNCERKSSAHTARKAHLTAIDVRDASSGEVRRHDCGGLFVFIGADAETGWLPAEIARDARGYVLTGDDVVKAGRWSHNRDPYLLETSAPGIFACGDVRLSPVKRVASAVGEGSMAIAFAHKYLQQDAR